MEGKKIETFDDWKDLFLVWQKDINYDTKLFSAVLQGYDFREKFRRSPAVHARYQIRAQDRRIQGQAVQRNGELLDDEAYTRHLSQTLPSDQDRSTLRRIAGEPKWIAPAA